MQDTDHLHFDCLATLCLELVHVKLNHKGWNDLSYKEARTLQLLNRGGYEDLVKANALCVV